MNDIVDRLMNYTTCTDADIDEAAAEIKRLRERVKERESELLRVRCHETAAAHAIDNTLTPEERARFKDLADENARLREQVAALLEERQIVHYMFASHLIEWSVWNYGNSRTVGLPDAYEAARSRVDMIMEKEDKP